MDDFPKVWDTKLLSRFELKAPPLPWRTRVLFWLLPRLPHRLRWWLVQRELKDLR